MTSGYVKRSILRTAVRESAQIAYDLGWYWTGV